MDRKGKAWVFAVTAPVLLMLSAWVIPGRPGPTQSALLWYNDLTEARAEARQAGKPLFVVFRCER